MGNACVVGAGNNHVPNAERAGNQNGPDGVQHSQIADEQVGGNQAAAEEHGDDEHDIEEALALEVRAGHGVGCQQRHHDGNDGEQNRVDHGILEARPDLRVGHDAFIGRQRPLAEIKGQSAVLQRDGVDKGCQNDVDNRQDNGCHKQAQYGVGEDHDCLVIAGKPGEFGVHCIFSFPQMPLPSLSFFTMLFMEIRSTTFMTVLNRPTAVEKP